MKTSKKILVSITIVAIVGIAGFAFAHGGFGNRGHHMGNMGYGGHMGMGTGYHMGYGDYGRDSGLTDEQLQSLDKSGNDFFNATHELRDDVYQKRLELRSELAKENPDIDKAKNIQKELSKIEAKFDQKRLDHELELRKIAPESKRGFFGRGFGRGFGGYCGR